MYTMNAIYLKFGENYFSCSTIYVRLVIIVLGWKDTSLHDRFVLMSIYHCGNYNAGVA
jgi:hypothetical protein